MCRILHDTSLKWKILMAKIEFKLRILVFKKISGSESFTGWLAPGSELGASWERAGASWSEGSETNVILGFRIPTTIGLRKPQLAPLAPSLLPLLPEYPWVPGASGGQGAMGKVGAS